MHAWRGWTATVGELTTAAPTWADWCAQLHRILRDEQRRQQDERGIPLTEREVARLPFVRWPYLTGHLDPRERDIV